MLPVAVNQEPSLDVDIVMSKFPALPWLLLSILVIVCDQISKGMISGHFTLGESVPVFPGFSLTLLHNTGAAFSFLSDAGGWQRWFFTIVVIGVTTGILVWLYRLPAGRNWLAAALALIVGGALGNLWDRLTLGYVVDFLHVYYGGWDFPAFNVADSAITIGAIMLIIDTIWFDQAEISTYHGNKSH